MSRHVKVEDMKAEDVPEMVAFMERLKERNNLDASIFTYPATKTLKASNGKTLVYLPKQLVFMLESLAINPQATVGEIGMALRALFTVTEFEALKLGMGEIYFLCADKETCDFAEHQGLEKVEGLTLYRRKL